MCCRCARRSRRLIFRTPLQPAEPAAPPSAQSRVPLRVHDMRPGGQGAGPGAGALEARPQPRALQPIQTSSRMASASASASRGPCLSRSSGRRRNPSPRSTSHPGAGRQPLQDDLQREFNSPSFFIATTSLLVRNSAPDGLDGGVSRQDRRDRRPDRSTKPRRAPLPRRHGCPRCPTSRRPRSEAAASAIPPHRDVPSPVDPPYGCGSAPGCELARTSARGTSALLQIGSPGTGGVKFRRRARPPSAQPVTADRCSAEKRCAERVGEGWWRVKQRGGLQASAG